MTAHPVPTARDNAFWQQVSELRPGLRRDVEILVQDYRNERWYLLHDKASGRFLRFNAAAYEFLGRIDGDLSITEIIDIANADADELVLEAEDVMQILAQLHGAEVLRDALPLSVQDLLDRYQKAVRFRRRRALSNPLALRLRLLDPDRLLSRMSVSSRWLFSWIGVLLWSLVVGLALVLALANTEAVLETASELTFNPASVLMFWLLYPVIKALHELGHGLAVKTWGGEVHEAGITLLVFMPVPYVDASAAWAFRDKRRRAIVGAAGILVELFVAAAAFLVWSVVEPGLVRDVAFNLALIGSVSTVLFNGNPLLRFDGYYVLEDLVEIPNLAARSSRYYLYLIQRHLFGIDSVHSPVMARGERAWFLSYGLSSPLYRVSVMIGIAWYLASEFFVIGVALALWVLGAQLLKPMLQSVHFVVASPRLQTHRTRAVLVAGMFLVAVVAALQLPMPLVSQAQGVIWPGDDAHVVNQTEGFVAEVSVDAGQVVQQGDVLLRLHAPELRVARAKLQVRLQSLRDEQIRLRQESRVRASMIADDIHAVRSEMTLLDSRIAGLVVRSPRAGRFYPVDPHDLTGKLIRQGDVIGLVIEPEPLMVRAVVDQGRIGLLRTTSTQAEVMLADRLGSPLPAEIVREVPAGSRSLPSAALGTMGGGSVAVDLLDETGTTAAKGVFQLDLALPQGTQVAGVGERVYVRLQHGYESLWRQWSRVLRQLLLSRLQV